MTNKNNVPVLATYTRPVKKMWYLIYEEMHTAESTKSYYPQYDTFTKWANDYAKEIGVSISLLWNRYKAGKIYAAYLERAKNTDRPTIPMHELTISPDNFITIDKIARGDTNYADELIEDILCGRLSRSSLNAIWKRTKISSDQMNKVAADSRFENIIMKNFKNSSWLQRYVKNHRFRIKYKLLPAGMHNMADFIIVENATSMYVDTLNFHLVFAESLASLMLLYPRTLQKLEFCFSQANYIWVTAPKDTVDSYSILPKLPEWCGVVTIDNDEIIEIVRFAEFNETADCHGLMHYAISELL